METIIERIEKLIELSGKSTYSVLRDCKLSHNAISVWRKGKAKPSLDAIIKLANYFNVSTDEIIGDREQTPELVKKVLLTHLTEDEIRLINGYRKADPVSRWRARQWAIPIPMPTFVDDTRGLDLLNKQDLKLNKKQQELYQKIQDGKIAENELIKSLRKDKQ